MTRLLVTGAAGYVGQRIIEIATGQRTVDPTLNPAPNNWDITGVFFRTPPPAHLSPLCRFVQVDLRDEEGVARVVETAQPQVVIHTAPSNQTEEQLSAIEPVARIVAHETGRHGARLVYVSTDMVFDGGRAPYADTDEPAPIFPYGEAKAKAEGLVREHAPNSVIARPSLIFGVDPIDRQTRWLVEGIRKKKAVRLFTDEYRCPIWVDNLACALLELAQIDYAGPLNLSGVQCLNRWEFGLKLLALLDLQAGDYVRQSTIAESGLRRPPDLRLDVRRAQSLLRTPLLSVDEAIEMMKAQRHSVAAGRGATLDD